MENRKVLIYNFGQHYREPIFKKLDEHIGFDFYFGDRNKDIKIFDYNTLKGYKGLLKNKKIFGPIYWQSGLLKLAFKNYEQYVLLGEYFCITHWVLFFILKLRNKKIHLWTHGWYGNETKMQANVKKLYFSFADKLWLYGEYSKNLMLKNGFSCNKLSVIYNSLNVEKQNEIYFTLSPNDIYKKRFNNNDKILFYIGRLQKRKKIEQIIEAIHLLKQNYNINYNFVAVGVGDELEALKKISQKYNLENNIWFYGASYKEEEIGNLIYNSDICISPGNVGLTAMHSLAYGTPVITHSNFTTQMPEFEAIKEGVSGLFFKEDSVESLASKIMELSTIIQAKGKDQIRKDCRKVILEKYNPNYQLNVIKQILNENVH